MAHAFSYRAARQDGTLERGHIEAEDRDSASRSIAARGLLTLELQQLATGSRRGRGVSLRDFATGIQMLAELLESGVPLNRALHVLETLAPVSWHRALPTIQSEVAQGASLCTAIRASALRCSELALGIIQAGEAGGNVAGALRRAAEVLETQLATRTAIRSALAYPLMLGAAGAASVALLVSVVLPRFAIILTDLGQDLPPTTRLVLATGEVMRDFGLAGLLAVAASGAGIHLWVNTAEGRERWHSWLLSLPIVGRVRLASASSYTAAALAALLESGLSISAALRHAAPAAGDAAVEGRLLKSREAVIRGESLSAALEKEQAVSPAAIRLIRTGEETGELKHMLGRSARVDSEYAQRLVSTAVRAAEPILILLFGGLVALIAAALLQAVYSIRPGL